MKGSFVGLVLDFGNLGLFCGVVCIAEGSQSRALLLLPTPPRLLGPLQDRLVTACYRGVYAGVVAALNDGASANAHGSNCAGCRQTPLYAAIPRDDGYANGDAGKRSAIVRLLLSRGAFPNGAGVMFKAARDGRYSDDVDLLSALVEAGGDVNTVSVLTARDAPNTLPLPLVFEAIQHRNQAIGESRLRILLDAPALSLDLDVTDNEGRSLEDVAITAGRFRMVTMIRTAVS